MSELYAFTVSEEDNSFPYSSSSSKSMLNYMSSLPFLRGVRGLKAGSFARNVEFWSSIM